MEKNNSKLCPINIGRAALVIPFFIHLFNKHLPGTKDLNLTETWCFPLGSYKSDHGTVQSVLWRVDGDAQCVRGTGIVHLSRPWRNCPGKLSSSLGNCRGLQIAQYCWSQGWMWRSVGDKAEHIERNGVTKALDTKWKSLNFLLESCWELLKDFKQGNGMIKKISITAAGTDWREATQRTGNAFRGYCKDLEMFSESKSGELCEQSGREEFKK